MFYENPADKYKEKKTKDLLQNVLSSQHLQVDVISGATYSSVVILKAVESALMDQKTR